MSGSIWIYLAIVLLALLLDAWTINSLMRSDRPKSIKVQWTFLILVLPFIGDAIWGVAGPRGVAVAPSSPNHSKG